MRAFEERRAALRSRQERLLGRALERAAGLSAYRDLLQGLSPLRSPSECLSWLPVIERSHVQADPEAFRDPFSASLRIKTSGSTSTPLVCHVDPSTRMRRAMQYSRFFVLHGWRPWHRSLTIRVVPDTSDRIGSPWLDRTVLSRRKVVSALDDPTDLFHDFRKHDPHILHALPSSLEMLAAELGNTAWRPIHLQKIFTASEACEPASRARLERLFGAPIADHYGAAEAFIGWECEQRNGYHINVDCVFIEVLDDAGENVAPGEVGRVVLSTLDNRAMPLIRYALGDHALQVDGSPCPCGRVEPRLPRVLGRAVESFLLSTGTRSPWGTMARMGEIDGLARFQLIQTDLDRIEARVRSRDVGRPVATQAVVTLVNETLGSGVQVDVVETDEFLMLPSGKFAPAMRALREASTCERIR